MQFGLFYVTDFYCPYYTIQIHADVSHMDDLQYLFNFDNLNISLSKEEDLFVSRIMVDLWTNFAATG